MLMQMMVIMEEVFINDGMQGSNLRKMFRKVEKATSTLVMMDRKLSLFFASKRLKLFKVWPFKNCCSRRKHNFLCLLTTL